VPFGSGKKIEDLEAEVARLNQWIAHLQGTDAVTLTNEIAAWRTELAGLQAQAAAARQTAQTARAEEQAARSDLAHDIDEAGLQEAGFYTFNHPLDDAVAYKAALTETQTRMKTLIRAGQAVEGATRWTVNNSAAQGRKMVKDTSTLMLRAYNAEADSLVRAMRPHALAAAKTRLDKSASAIERLGKTMSIRISPDYHGLRVHELELTADFLVRKEQEKEAERERRAELRDQKKAAQEMAAALDKLRKEHAHYSNLLTKLDPTTDPDAYAQAQAKLGEIGDSISGVEQRAANIRTGHVYVISNIGAFGPDMVKIGMTRRLEPMDRVIELGDASVPFRFDVHALVFHQDAVSLETHLHQALADRKVNQMNPRREFFYATPGEVRDIIGAYDGSLLVEYKEKADATEWRNSGAIARDTPQPATLDDLASDALADALSDDLNEPTVSAHEASQDAVVDDNDEISLDTLGVVDSEDDNDPAGEPLSPSPALSLDSNQAVTAQATPANSVSAARPIADQPPVPTVPSGWYPNPDNDAQWRYWDGQSWTGNVSPR
jgi:Domain of unknown function (DUF4041)/T5orf172 domain/Protein of unknown function (DUF2510)